MKSEYVASKYFQMEFLLILSSNEYLMFHKFDISSLKNQERCVLKYFSQ